MLFNKFSFFILLINLIIKPSIGHTYDNNVNIPSLCPVTDQFDYEEAHVAFVISDRDILQIRNEITKLLERDYQTFLKPKDSILKTYKHKAVLWFTAGKEKVFQYPESQREFIAIRQVGDCILNADKEEVLAPYVHKTYILTRSFFDENLNTAITSALISIADKFIPLSTQGESWICQSSPTNSFCR